MTCTTFARVDPETLEVTLKYNTNGGSKWALDDIECEIPFDVLTDQAVLVDGSITLTTDPAKVQARADAAWTQLRAQRNDRLTASDWTQLQDTHMSTDKQGAWADYRQELRDLPDLITDPTSITWPLKPGEIPPTPVNSSRFGSLLEHAGEEPAVVEEVPVVEPVPEAEPVQEVTEAEPVEEVTEAEPVQEVTPVEEVPDAEPVPEAEPVQEVPVVEEAPVEPVV
jgi:hypothetical protein